MAINVNTLSEYMKNSMSMLIMGPAGTGKTQMLRSAADSLGMKMKYYNSATLDAFVDLLGVPVPDTENKRVEYYRPKDIDEAEVVFFDEINRASTQTINTVFEVLQFGTINGNPLPNLKCVVAAMNPVGDGYEGTDELDLAFVDRFNLYLTADVAADPIYFKKKFGADYARVAIDLFNDYQTTYNAALRSKQNKMGYFSPRRLEIMMENFEKFPRAETIRASLPSDVVISARTYAEKFNIALGNKKVPGVASRAAAHSTVNANEHSVDWQLKMTASDMRSVKNASSFKDAFQFAKVMDRENNTRKASALLNSLAVALSHDVGVKGFQSYWGDIVKEMTPGQLSKMTSPWPNAKKKAIGEALNINF